MTVPNSGAAREKCKAGCAVSSPGAEHSSALLRHAARTSAVALCQGGNVELVSKRAEHGAAFMIPTPLDCR